MRYLKTYKKRSPLAIAALLSGLIMPLHAQADELIVTGERFSESPAAITHIDQKTIADQQFTYIHDALRAHVPSLAFNQTGGAGTLASVYLRGVVGRYVVARLNGVKLNTPAGQQPLWANLGIVGISQIDVLRGTQSALYGSEAVGGVINMETAIGGENRHQLGLELGHYDSRKLDWASQGSARDGRLDYGFAAQHVSTKGFSAHRSNIEADANQNTSFITRGAWHIDDEKRVFLSSYVNGGASEYDRCGFPASNICESKHETHIIRSGFGHEIDGLSYEVAAHYYNDKRDEYHNIALNSGGRARRSGIEFRGRYQLNDSSRLVFGGEVLRASLDSFTTQSDRYHVAETQAAWLMWDAKFIDALHLTLAARADAHDAFGSFLSWRANLLWDVSAHIKLRLAGGHGFRAPSLDDLYFPGFGNPDLEAETSQSYDVSVIVIPRENMALEFTAFDIAIDNRIGFDNNTFRAAQVAGKSASQGIEMQFRWDAADDLRLSASYAYVDAKKPSGVRDIRRPKHSLSFNIDATLADNFSGGFSLVAVRDVLDSDFSSFPANDVPLDDYILVNLRARYQFARGFLLYGRVDNLFDDDYQTVLGYNSGGSNLTIGVRKTF